MFSLFQGNQAHESSALLRHLCELTAVRIEGQEAVRRSSPRLHCTIPILVAPFDADQLDVHAVTLAYTALATDLSENGVGLVSRRSPEESELLLGFLLELTHGACAEFFRGHVQHIEAIGAGYFHIGIEVRSRLTSHEHPLMTSLTRVALRMLPLDT